ncbi:MAG: flippase [Candidatus Omnitrophica bacterium]|nr:flippase [Candidatus Omnitrophota bacterium]
MLLPFQFKPKVVRPHEKRIVLENFISLSTLQGLSYILPIIVLPYLIRVIGADKFGLIAFAQAFVQYFMIITDYGFGISATKKIALCKDDTGKMNTIFSSVMSAKFILTILSFIFFLIIVTSVPKFRNDWWVYILSFGAVTGNTLFPVWFFQGREKMAYIASVNIIGGIFYAIGIFVFVKSPHDYLYVPAFNSIFSLSVGLYALHIAFKKFGLEFIDQGYRDIQRELKTGWNIFISNVAINAYTTTRVFAVGLLTNNTITGYYSIAERIAGFTQSFPLGSLSQAFYPRINKIFNQSKKRALRIMQRMQHSTIITSLISLSIIFAITPLIVKFVTGKYCPESIIVLRLLIISILFVSANTFRVQFLLVYGRFDIYAKLHITAALIGTPLIFILVSYYSYLGAALSTTIIEAGVFIATFWIIKRIVKS